MSDDRDGESWTFDVPFVATEVNGGPYDDEAFHAGFQCGDLFARLSMNSQFKHPALGTPDPIVVYSTVAHQIDLIAMRFGFLTHIEPLDDTWTRLTFHPSEGL